MHLNLVRALRAVIRHNGPRPAMLDVARTYSWNEFGDRVGRAAGALRAMGVDKDKRFAVLARNGFRQEELKWAGFWLGAIPVPVNWRLAPPEIAHILEDAEAECLLVENHFQSVLDHPAMSAWKSKATVIGDIAGPTLGEYEDMLARATAPPPADPAPDDDAMLIYTGGTTGRSKGVRLTHLNIVTNGVAFGLGIAARREQPYLHAAPMFHSADLLGTGYTLLGGSHAYLPQFSPKNVLAAIQDLRVTATMLAPTMIIMTLQDLKPADFDLRSFRWFLYGSAPMAPEWIVKSIEAFPGVEVCQGYGLTETSPILTYLDFDEHKKALATKDYTRLKAAGRPIAGVDMRILDNRGREAPLGEAGEVVVRAPNVTKGYLNLPDVTAAAIRDGWFHTGDVGRMDEEGFMYLLDRKKDMIITGGENVYTVEVEQALYQHPAVAECAVVG
ncbi:MAG: AMP-binding protein, partial [Alphaproteobacteria bacterium]